MPKSDAQRHLALLQDYQDVVAGVGVIRDAIERAFDVHCLQPRRPKRSSRRSSRPSTLQRLNYGRRLLMLRPPLTRPHEPIFRSV